MKIALAFVLPFLLVSMRPALSQAAVYNVSTAADLRAKLTTAIAGDEIVVADGTYTGPFNITGNTGTATSPITVRAANRHKAVIDGNGSDTDANNRAFQVYRAYWIIDGFDIREHQVPIILETTAHHAEIRHNLIHDFTRHGVWINQSSSHTFHSNVFARCSCFSTANSWAAIYFDVGSSGNTVQSNIMYSMTNGKMLEVGSPNGMALAGGGNNDNNLIQGNLFMDGAKSTALRFFGAQASVTANPSGPQAQGNTFRDNIVAHGQGGGVGFGENAIDNVVTNNITYGMFFAGLASKGNDPGRNSFTHNTIIMTPYSVKGLLLDHDNINVPSKASVVQNNLLYADFPISRGQFLMQVTNWPQAITESNFNLFWRPGSTSTWVTNVTYGGSDIHDPAREPIFVDKASGDFTLVAGSPGKSSASDGTDRGAIFSGSLRRSWMRKVVTLPTQEKLTNGSTSISFTTNSANQYQVFAYVPEINPYTGSESFLIEGINSMASEGGINIGTLLNRGSWGGLWIDAAPQRYMYLGTYSNDGTLNVTWQHPNAAGKIFIRQMPTVQEAYSWITMPEGVNIPAAPQNLIMVSAP